MTQANRPPRFPARFKLLAQLEQVEALAQRLERARRLRRLVDTLEAANPSAVQRLVPSLQWVRDAADWLDPAVAKDWPEVDDVDLFP